jgi:hypothetical protein
MPKLCIHLPLRIGLTGDCRWESLIGFALESGTPSTGFLSSCQLGQHNTDFFLERRPGEWDRLIILMKASRISSSASTSFVLSRIVGYLPPCPYPTTASSIATDQSTLLDSITRW